MRSQTGSRRNESGNFHESEGDCTGERVAGQFSIFGAIEEKSADGFLGSGTDEPKLRTLRSTARSRSFLFRGSMRGKSGRVSSRNVHRACTGNAERQWAVGSG